MKRRIKSILMVAICAVILCAMVLSVSASTHSKYQDTVYEDESGRPWIKIKSCVQANFRDEEYFSYAYAAMRYDEYYANENLTGSSKYGNLYVSVLIGKYTSTGHSSIYASETKTLIINNPEEDYVGVGYTFNATDKVDRIRCEYTARLMDEAGEKILIPDIVGSYNTLDKK